MTSSSTSSSSPPPVDLDRRPGWLRRLVNQALQELAIMRRRSRPRPAGLHPRDAHGQYVSPKATSKRRRRWR